LKSTFVTKEVPSWLFSLLRPQGLDTWAAIVETARSVGLDEGRIQRATM
jgi:hypothetical protein